jgi:hypothetical protein
MPSAPATAQNTEAVKDYSSTPEREKPAGALVFNHSLLEADTLEKFNCSFGQYGGHAAVVPGSGLRLASAHTLTMLWPKPFLGDRYRVQFEVQLRGVHRWAGWTLNGPGFGNNPDTGYYCGFDSGLEAGGDLTTFWLRRQGLELQATALPKPIGSGEWASVQADVSGGNIAVTVNGFLVTQFSDPALLTGPLHGWFGLTAGLADFRNLRIWSSTKDTTRERQLTPPATEKPLANGELLYELKLKAGDVASEWWKSLPSHVAVENGALVLSGRDNGTPAVVLTKPLPPELACEVEFEYPTHEAVNLAANLWFATKSSLSDWEGRWVVMLPTGDGRTQVEWRRGPQDVRKDGFDTRGPVLVTTPYYAPVSRRKYLARIETYRNELRLFLDGGLVLTGRRPEMAASEAMPVFLMLSQLYGGSKLHAVRVYALKRPPFDADRHALLEGVGVIAAPGQPGSLCVFGPQAEALVCGREWASDVVVAYASWESGRVVAYAHDGYLNPVTLAAADTGRLFLNSIAWAANAKGLKARVGVPVHYDLLKWLEQKGVAVVPLSGPEWWKELERIDVLVTHTSGLAAPEARAAVKTFITSGGGIIAADTGWGWLQLNPGKTIVGDHPGNLLLYSAGLSWTDEFSLGNSPDGFKVGDTLSPYVHAGAALEALVQQERGEKRLSHEEQEGCLRAIRVALRTLPPDDPVVVKKLRSVRKMFDRPVVPSPQTTGWLWRVRVEDGLRRAFVLQDHDEMMTKPANEIAAHPAAAFFPGEVPKAAKSMHKKLTINTRTPGWHSTGLYVRPGELVVVTLPPQAADKGLSLLIGCHTDNIGGPNEWRRMPVVSRTWPLHQAITEGANFVGGLVYINVPHGCALGEIEAEIAGAVEAPLFVLGETKLDDWISRISKLPGPWAELATKKIILTVPSRAVKELRDPVDPLQVWDQVMDACADLARIPRDRGWPERIVVDEQISAGSLHAGYPIMAHLDTANGIVNYNSAVIARGEGAWAFFHEIGHNHQMPEWTFDGAGEVTVNLFTMYVHDKVCKRTDLGTELTNQAERNKKIKPYFDSGAKFQDWKSDPFLALCMYIQLQQAFGWEAFQDVFEEYRKLPQAERPKNDDEKRDQWMVRFSRRAGKNLGPFFEVWGVPISAAARAQVANLPTWLPENFPPK